MKNVRFINLISVFSLFLCYSFMVSCQKDPVDAPDPGFINNNNQNEEDNEDDNNDNNSDNNDDGSVIDGYRLIWEEQFDGTELNPEVWNIEVNGKGGGNRELQYYREENVSLGKEPESGKQCLIITAKKETYENKQATSGRINTMGKKFFRYGRFEASIKLPKTANGLWPAFWMMGNDYEQIGWPQCGEIDILEMGNQQGIKDGTQEYLFNGACHWGKLDGGSNPSYAKHTVNEYSLQDGDFHLFTMFWTEDKIEMYLDIDKYPDAEPYFTMVIRGMGMDTDSSLYFRKEFFFLINLAVGGTFPNILNINGITALSSGEAKMYVDYVRVYEKVD